MARKIRIPPERIENIHGVRLAAAGVLNLLMLAAAALGVGSGAFNAAGILVAALFGGMAGVVLAPVLWRGTKADRWLAALALLPPVGLLLMMNGR